MIVIFNDIVGITRSERESMRMTDRMEAVFFQYGETEIDYLKRKDKRLGEVRRILICFLLSSIILLVSRFLRKLRSLSGIG